MAQNTWFYTFPNGKKYEIGIFHSLDGHVVIYCQGEIMVIDFNVTDDKEYSFFIENKLVKINVEKENESTFRYVLSEENLQPQVIHSSSDKKYNVHLPISILFLMVLFAFSVYLLLKR